MLSKTQGIVLNYVKYRETSVIARIYTEAFGFQSFIINGIRSKKSKKGLALLQPLTLLDMVVYYKKNKEDAIHRISEYKCLEHFSSIPFDIKKSSMALFITELLVKVLQEEEHHGGAYDYLHRFISKLDKTEKGFENMHLALLVSLAQYLGFGIHSIEDLMRQDFSIASLSTKEEMFRMILLLQEQPDQAVSSNQLRRDLLKYLIAYYQRHVEGFEGLNSIEVLNQIFS